MLEQCLGIQCSEEKLDILTTVRKKKRVKTFPKQLTKTKHLERLQNHEESVEKEISGMFCLKSLKENDWNSSQKNDASKMMNVRDTVIKEVTKYKPCGKNGPERQRIGNL